MTAPTIDDTSTEVAEVPELTDRWLAADLRDHIELYHVGKHKGYQVNNLMPGYDQTFDKCRKSSLIQAHERLHADPSPRLTLIAHRHYALTESDEVAPSGEKLKAGDAPLLKVDERKTLKELVDSDFAALRAQINQTADDVLAEQLRQITEEFKGAEAQARKFLDKRTKLGRKHEEELAKLKNKHADEVTALNEEARAAGLEPAGTSSYAPADRDARIKEVTDENKRDKDRALNAAERQRLGTQRTVLLTGLTGAAQVVLNQIPSAETLMIAAARERSEREATARAITAATATATK